MNIEKLHEQVRQFQTLTLPGQPIMMHMGTLYLVRDLMRAVEQLVAQLRQADDLIYRYIDPFLIAKTDDEAYAASHARAKSAS